MMKRLTRVRALFGFLRLRRHELFDSAFQDELASMYRDSGAGDEPHPPAMLCMVLLLQGYVGASDAEAVELAVMDLRWQMVLDCLGADAPPFSQGALQGFRERLIAHGRDRVLLEKSVALVRAKAFSEAEGKALSKAVRVAVDSRPLVGAGRVEDTKRDFTIDLRTSTITCPEGQVEPFEPGSTVAFDPEACGACPQRDKCTTAASGRGRTVSIAEDESLQKRFRRLQESGRGRQALRERVQVEHALAHIAARKGDNARYAGVRKNLFDLRRAVVNQNLEAAQRSARAA